MFQVVTAVRRFFKKWLEVVSLPYSFLDNEILLGSGMWLLGHIYYGVIVYCLNSDYATVANWVIYKEHGFNDLQFWRVGSGHNCWGLSGFVIT